MGAGPVVTAGIAWSKPQYLGFFFQFNLPFRGLEKDFRRSFFQFSLKKKISLKQTFSERRRNGELGVSGNMAERPLGTPDSAESGWYPLTRPLVSVAVWTLTWPVHSSRPWGLCFPKRA